MGREGNGRGLSLPKVNFLVTSLEHGATNAMITTMRQDNFDSTWIRRVFDCLSKVIKVTLTSRSHADLFIYLGLSAARSR